MPWGITEESHSGFYVGFQVFWIDGFSSGGVYGPSGRCVTKELSQTSKVSLWLSSSQTGRRPWEDTVTMYVSIPRSYARKQEQFNQYYSCHFPLSLNLWPELTMNCFAFLCFWFPLTACGRSTNKLGAGGGRKARKKVKGEPGKA